MIDHYTILISRNLIQGEHQVQGTFNTTHCTAITYRCILGGPHKEYYLCSIAWASAAWFFSFSFSLPFSTNRTYIHYRYKKIVEKPQKGLREDYYLLNITLNSYRRMHIQIVFRMFDHVSIYFINTRKIKIETLYLKAVRIGWSPTIIWYHDLVYA